MAEGSVGPMAIPSGRAHCMPKVIAAALEVPLHQDHPLGFCAGGRTRRAVRLDD
jgi:hypothetical protein